MAQTAPAPAFLNWKGRYAGREDDERTWLAELDGLFKYWSKHTLDPRRYHVSSSPQEDRGGTAGEVGQGEGWEEEGGIELWTRRENDSSHLQTEEEAYAACNRSSSASF